MELGGFIPAGDILKSGVYALVFHGQVVYIGKSKCMLQRLYSHRNLSGNRANIPKWMPSSVRGIKYDDVHIRPCSLDVIDELESEMINLYKPKLNINLKKPQPPTGPAVIVVNGISLTLRPRVETKVSPPAPKFERRV